MRKINKEIIMKNLKYQKTLIIAILGISVYAGAQSATTTNNMQQNQNNATQNLVNSPDEPTNPAFPRNQNLMGTPGICSRYRQ